MEVSHLPQQDQQQQQQQQSQQQQQQQQLQQSQQAALSGKTLDAQQVLPNGEQPRTIPVVPSQYTANQAQPGQQAYTTVPEYAAQSVESGLKHQEGGFMSLAEDSRNAVSSPGEQVEGLAALTGEQRQRVEYLQRMPSYQAIIQADFKPLQKLMGKVSMLPRRPDVSKGKYSLKDFQMLRTLGTGSFGRVHLVRSVHNHRYYAIKVLKKAQVIKMKQVEHTNDERRMLKLVEHPFLIRMWGTFQDSRNLFMVMDFIEGGELFSLLRKSQRFPNPVAKFYAAEVILAIEYLHSHNIIYRDLKPENILLDRNGHIKITDFGFAKEVETVTWTLCGTPDYIAPEVITTKPYNKSVDWWSLGILIYEMLAGYTPFYDQTPMKTYEKILVGKVFYPSYFHPDVVDLLSKLITSDLTRRFGNLQNGAEDIRNHPWFSEVVWEKLLMKDIETPYEPPITAGVGDTSLFDRYPETQMDYGVQCDDPYADYFKDF